MPRAAILAAILSIAFALPAPAQSLSILLPAISFPDPAPSLSTKGCNAESPKTTCARQS